MFDTVPYGFSIVGMHDDQYDDSIQIDDSIVQYTGFTPRISLFLGVPTCDDCDLLVVDKCPYHARQAQLQQDASLLDWPPDDTPSPAMVAFDASVQAQYNVVGTCGFCRQAQVWTRPAPVFRRVCRPCVDDTAGRVLFTARQLADRYGRRFRRDMPDNIINDDQHVPWQFIPDPDGRFNLDHPVTRGGSTYYIQHVWIPDDTGRLYKGTDYVMTGQWVPVPRG